MALLPDRIGADLRRRVAARIVENGAGCWLWQGQLGQGYGTFRLASGRRIAAARLVWLLERGQLPAEGILLRHLCRVKLCVNPAHLEPATIGEVVLGGKSASARNARKVACPRGHPYDEANTYVARDGRRRCRACQRERYHESGSERRRQRKAAA